MQKQISQYIFDRIKASGVDCTFGIPGDFLLPLYAAQEEAGLKTVVLTHEPSLGFAADAYARIKGLGVALVTYGAGGLNMINPVACAYAEDSPLLIIGGAPETKYHTSAARFHHCVKTFATQQNIYAEVTAISAAVNKADNAQQTIDTVFDTVLSCSKPAYLELPRDMVGANISLSNTSKRTAEEHNQAQSAKALAKICNNLSKAKQPVILAGVQLSRFSLLPAVLKISQALNIPVVTSILGKSSFPEFHPNFIGTYFGHFANPAIAEFVENCDLVINLGAILNEMETGAYTASLSKERLIVLNNEEINVSGEQFSDVDFKKLMKEVAEQVSKNVSSFPQFQMPKFSLEQIESTANTLSIAHMINSINHIIDENTCIVSDVGDCLYAGLSLKTNCFVAPGYYSTMGFGVPGSIGVQLADRSKRPIVLVGDGAFQMTGMEIATAVKEGLNPIVIVFNNARYGMLKSIDKDRSYYGLASWDYVGIAKALGAQGYRAETPAEFDHCLQNALKSDSALLIDAVLSPEDISPTLKRLTEYIGNKMRKSGSLQSG